MDVRRLAVVLFTVALAGCGAPAEDAGTANDEPVAAWSELTSNYNGFLTRYSRRGPDPQPNAAKMRRAVGYRFDEGVTLAVYGREGDRMCFTGNADTFLTVVSKPDGGRTQRILGTGPCDYQDGDVVLREVATGESVLVEKVFAGQELVDRIDGLAYFGDISPMDE